MIALDTNIVVRLIVNDDAEQVAQARQLFDTPPLLLLTGVVLEAEWVLRKTYGLSRQRFCSSLRRMCGLPEVRLAEPQVVEAALGLHEIGFDFADALHIVMLPEHVSLATFDRSLVKRARKHLGEAVVMGLGRSGS